ncbi:MAG: hypothetical protein V3V08_15525 [Nannocystaceae bacterium]
MLHASSPHTLERRISEMDGLITDLQVRLAFLDETVVQQDAVIRAYTERVDTLERAVRRLEAADANSHEGEVGGR